MSSTPTFEDTLNNMANLEGLTDFIQSSHNKLEDKRRNIIKIIQHMRDQIKAVESQIDSLKSQGSSATTEMKKLIADADSKQTKALDNVKTIINSMIDLEELQTAVDNLGHDITSLTNVTTGTSDSKTPNHPSNLNHQMLLLLIQLMILPVSNNNTSKQATSNKQNGGYTYGKSRRSHRKHRTHRTHRKRHMGGFKKSKKK